MFTLFLLKVKSVLFGNLSSIFLVGLVAIIGMIGIFNADTILSKMGMETRSTLTAKLAKAEEQLKVVVATNKELNDKIEKINRDGVFRTTLVEENCKESKEITEAIADSKSTLDQTATVIKRGPRKIASASKHKASESDGSKSASNTSESDESLLLKMTNQLSPDQLNALSQSNITAINSTYDGLFNKG